jgi:amidase
VTDFGGSIRIPAGCTGLVGLKAGRGVIPFGPDESEPFNGLFTHGVISRSVRDTAAMLDGLAGPDAMAAFAPALTPTSFLDSLDRPPDRLRVGYTTHSAIRPSADPESSCRKPGTAAATTSPDLPACTPPMTC